MKVADLRIQTTTPDVPTTSSVVGVYADPSGVLVSLNAAGTRYNVGQVFTGSAANLGFSPSASLSVGITGALTGAAIFLRVVGPSGQDFGIPVWRLT